MALILLCGLSFSGKSTLAQELARELGTATILSLDAINNERGLCGGRAIPGDEWEKTHRIAEERASDRIRSGRDVIVDDTGSPRFVRDRWREIADREHAPFTILWVTIDAELQKTRWLANRTSNERHDVTDDVMVEHRVTFEPPTTEHPITIDAREVHNIDQVRRVAAEITARAAE